MAKSKKSESASPASAKKTPATPVRKKPEPKKSTTSGSPLINTDFAAQSAARMLMAKKSNSINTETGRKESSTFKQMKDNLAKPHLSGMSNLPTTTPGANRSNTPFSQQNQRSNVNTHGSDARTGVPRRTPG
jgi:hypothetical protein